MVMRRALLLSILIISGVIAGCSSGRENSQRLNAEMAALRNQQAERNAEMAQRLLTLSERIASVEKGQAATVSTSEEVRAEMQNLRDEFQQAMRRLQGSAGVGGSSRDALATKLAEVETRLRDLESTLMPERTMRSTSEVPDEGAVSSARAAPPASEVPAATEPGAQLYRQALQEYRQGDYEAAIVAFKEYVQQHSTSPLASNAQYWIGEALYAQQQFEAAIVAFDEVVRKYPSAEKVPAALLKQGYAFAELDDARNARFFLQQVQRRYPQSPEAQQAAEKLQQL